MTRGYVDGLVYKIIGCAIEVHKTLGPGLLESVYEKCFVHELSVRRIQYERQVWLPVSYKNINIDAQLKVDVLVEDSVVVELKAIDGIIPVHAAQVLTYMKLLKKPKGIIINFNCTNIFKDGQRTFVNEFYETLAVC